MKCPLLLLSTLIGLASYGQTWSDDIATIIYNNCSTCHNEQSIGPFELITYQQVQAFSTDIIEAVESDYMPPWTADNNYSDLSHSRKLSSEDKTTLLNWLESGMPVGLVENIPPPPVFEYSGFIQAPADLELTMDAHVSNATENDDDYICVSIPSGLTEDKVIKAFEIIPGNPSILHHCLVYIDPTGAYPNDFSGTCVGPSNDAGLIGGYTPGAVPTVFPSNDEDVNLGITIPAGSNIVLAMHYPHGSLGETDQSSIKLYFYEDDVDHREVSTYPLIQNWSFFLPANQETEVSATYSNFNVDFSILSAFPHMHLIGDNITSYAVTPEEDLIPLINIPHWDFEWQEFYFFQELQRVPAGSTLHGTGSYNNTSENHHNPNDPPLAVGPGLNTSDEMFLVYYHYLPYLEGDELLDIEALTSLPTHLYEVPMENGSTVSVFPNPASNLVNFELNLIASSTVSLSIYSSQGQIVSEVLQNQNTPAGINRTVYDSSKLLSGLYYYSLMVNGAAYSGQFLIN